MRYALVVIVTLWFWPKLERLWAAWQEAGDYENENSAESEGKLTLSKWAKRYTISQWRTLRAIKDNRQRLEREVWFRTGPISKALYEIDFDMRVGGCAGIQETALTLSGIEGWAPAHSKECQGWLENIGLLEEFKDWEARQMEIFGDCHRLVDQSSSDLEALEALKEKFSHWIVQTTGILAFAKSRLDAHYLFSVRRVRQV